MISSDDVMIRRHISCGIFHSTYFIRHNLLNWRHAASAARAAWLKILLWMKIYIDKLTSRVPVNTNFSWLPTEIRKLRNRRRSFVAEMMSKDTEIKCTNHSVYIILEYTSCNVLFPIHFAGLQDSMRALGSWHHTKNKSSGNLGVM